MPAMQQVSTQQAPNYQGLSPLDPGFVDQQVQGFQKRTQPQYKQGLRDLRSYMRSSRGLGDSGIEASQVAGLQQSRASDLGDFASQAQSNQAQMQEIERQRQQQRAWQVEDRDFQAQKQAEAMAAQERAQQGQLWGDILGAVGGPIGYGVAKLLGGNSSASSVPNGLAPSLDFMPQGVPDYDAEMRALMQAQANAAQGRR